MNRNETLSSWIIAAAAGVGLVLLVDIFTGSMPPMWDAVHYLNIAESGIIGQENLIAPFAYRPAVPFLSRIVSIALNIDTVNGFLIVNWCFAALFLVSVYMLASEFTPSWRHSLIISAVAAFSAAHVKFPLFCYCLVDVPAYALVTFAFWALISRKYGICLLLSVPGLLVKEWLAVPWAIACIALFDDIRKNRSRMSVSLLLAGAAAGMFLIILPRLCLPVSGTSQFIDPLHSPCTMKRIGSAWADGARMFNIIYSLIGYWLPTLILATGARFRRLKGELDGFKLRVLASYSALVLILTVYGGTNIAIFCAYTVPVQVVILAYIYRGRVKLWETLYLLAAIFLFNRIFQDIPSPVQDVNAYLDFYGGWADRITDSTYMRLGECVLYVLLAACVRVFAGNEK